MTISIPKGLLKIYIKCSTCGICIGPSYLYRTFHDVGIYKLCPPCFASLNKNGFLYLEDKYSEDKMILAEIMLLDGTKTLIPRKDLD